MHRVLAATSVAILSATTAFAEGYRCEVTDMTGGFLSSWLGIKLETGAATATVYDAYIREVHGEPIEVAFKDRGKGRIRLTYTLLNVPTTQAPVRISYTINLDTTASTVSVRGNIFGATNMIVGKGQCQKGPFSFI